MKATHGWGGIVLIACLALTVLVYWPGLYGGYLFDDSPNFVDNRDVHVATLNWRDWYAAAQASPSSDLRRPLAMLSLAANYYFTQLDPFPLKLVNLAIHLLNGTLLWQVLLGLLGLWRRRFAQGVPDSAIQTMALGVSCAWLLAPINLTPVLYVVQRMESMAQTFVLLGLLLYLAGRRRMLGGATSLGMALCATGLAGGSALGFLCKESALLLPLYAFLAELTLLRLEAPNAAARRALWTLYAIFLFVPTALALAWLLPHTLSAAAYSARPFTLAQRLLTETRVLVDYIGWTLLPNPGTLSFYHDDIPLSRAWLDPPTTLGAAALICGALAVAVLLRRRLPLLSLGIGWYFAAHLMTATVIPLELVFEHRNYFASAGLLLAAGALVTTIPNQFKLVRWTVPLLAIGLFSAVTWLRATEWRNPVALAYSEAAKHPLSARANTELGQTLIAVSHYRPDSKLIDPAMEAFERAARLPDSSAAPLIGMIVVAEHLHRKVPLEWWTHLDDKLASQPPSPESISALQALTDCQRTGECVPETEQLLGAYMAALSHPNPGGILLANYGAFAANQLGDYPLAEQVLSDALTPDAEQIQLNLAKVLFLEGKAERANEFLAALRSRKLSSAMEAQVKSLNADLGAVTPKDATRPR